MDREQVCAQVLWFLVYDRLVRINIVVRSEWLLVEKDERRGGCF